MTGDYSAYNGKIKVRLSRPGTYTWCETKAPTGYLLTSPTCGTFTGAWEAPDTVILLKHQKKLVYFPF